MQAIIGSLHKCHDDLAAPNFRKVYVTMDSPLHRDMIAELRRKGVDVLKTTDENDDVLRSAAGMF